MSAWALLLMASACSAAARAVLMAAACSAVCGSRGTTTHLLPQPPRRPRMRAPPFRYQIRFERSAVSVRTKAALCERSCAYCEVVTSHWDPATYLHQACIGSWHHGCAGWVHAMASSCVAHGPGYIIDSIIYYHLITNIMLIYMLAAITFGAVIPRPISCVARVCPRMINS